MPYSARVRASLLGGAGLGAGTGGCRAASFVPIGCGSDPYGRYEYELDAGIVEAGTDVFFSVEARRDYELTVELSGFSRYVRSGLTLALNQTAVVDVEIRPAALSEVVQVTSEPGRGTTVEVRFPAAGR